MKNKQTLNGFDSVFEAVFNGITQTKNCGLVIECKHSMELHTFFLRNLLDVNNYYFLYKNAFIPAANKSVSETKNQYARSKYKSLVNASELDLKENLYETVRLGYVGLFHKIEGYTKGIKRNFKLINLAYEIEGDFNIFDKLNEIFLVDITSPVSISGINKIRVISNAVKHCNGYPQTPSKEKDDLTRYINNQKMDSKIDIDPELFMLDISFVMDYFSFIQSTIHVFAALHLTGVLDGTTEALKAKMDEAMVQNPV